MFVYKWYLVGIMRKSVKASCHHKSRKTRIEEYPRVITYDAGEETCSIEKCLKDGYAHFKKIDYPDCYGCRLVIDVKNTGSEECDCERSSSDLDD